MARKHYAKDSGAIRNAAERLLANIRFASMDSRISSVVITSSMPDEGKSTVALSLATAIAKSGKTVLLVECDMRRRTLAGRVGAHPKAGLYAVLAEQAKLTEAAVPLSPAGLYLLDAEPSIPSPSDLLASNRFQKLHVQMKETYDYVVMDTPPVGAFVDAAVVASHADATVLVVREGFARRENVASAVEQLKKADANVIGVCMNYCDYTGSSYYGYEKYLSGKGSSSYKDEQAAQASRVASPRGGSAGYQGKRFSS